MATLTKVYSPMPATDESVFPLPLTPFESLMVANDTDEYPMVFEVIADFRGTIEKDPFEHAIETACQRHSLFGCRVAGKPFGGAAWIRCSNWKPEIIWATDLNSDELRPPMKQRLHDDPYFRAWAINNGDRSRVVFQFHHAVTDGLSAVQFIGEVLQQYDNNITGSQTTITMPNYADFPHRANAKKTSKNELSTFQWLRSLAREAILVLRQKPVPLAPPKKISDAPLRYGEYMTLALDRTEFGLYRQAAFERQVGVNDLLLSHMMVALAQWQRKHGLKGKRSWLRVTMPVSYHHRVSRSLPACNRVNFAFISRQISSASKFDELLLGIAGETRTISQYELADHFAATLQAVGRVPGLLRHLTSPRKCFATAVFSNMGDIVRHCRMKLRRDEGQVLSGGLCMERLIAASPLQANTRLALCAIVYAGRLYLTFRFDPRHFDRPAGETFITSMKGIMSETAFPTESD